MKKIVFLFILCFTSLAYVHAETIVLRTGARVRGTIVFQNEEVVIVRNTEGARFQYPRADVEFILTAEEAPEEEVKVEEEVVQTSKKASILIELGGNGSFVPQGEAGGGFAVDLLVGSHHIGDRHLFIGGGLGFHGVFVGSQVYNFLPLQVALRMPLIESKHAPMFGVGVGYGIAVNETLQAHERCVSLVAVVHILFDAQFLERQHTADTQHDLLFNTVLPVSTVELVGDLTIPFRVEFIVGVEQVEVHASNCYFPQVRFHYATRIRHFDHHVRAIRLFHLRDR